MVTKAPFGWVGGKSKLAAQIVASFPSHICYCEVFAGSLAVLFSKPKGKVEVINDIDNNLINLWRIIQSRPQSLSYRLERLPISRVLFEGVRDRKVKPRDKIEQAAMTYMSIKASFGSARSHYAMTRVRAINIYRDFVAVSKRLRGASIESMSYEKLIANYDAEGTLFYLDPPYFGCENYYLGSLEGGFGRGDHERLASILKGIKGKFVLSYNDTPEIRELYKDFTIEGIDTSYTLANRGGRKYVTELLIAN